MGPYYTPLVLYLIIRVGMIVLELFVLVVQLVRKETNEAASLLTGFVAAWVVARMMAPFPL